MQRNGQLQKGATSKGHQIKRMKGKACRKKGQDGQSVKGQGQSHLKCRGTPRARKTWATSPRCRSIYWRWAWGEREQMNEAKHRSIEIKVGKRRNSTRIEEQKEYN